MASQVFEDGQYRLRTMKWALSKNKHDNWQLWISAKVIAAIVDVDGGDTVESPLASPIARQLYLVITEATIDNFRKKVEKAFGYTGKSLKPLSPQSPDAVDLFGKEFIATCKIETWKGKAREKWDIDSRGAVKPLTTEELEELDKQFFGEEEEPLPNIVF